QIDACDISLSKNSHIMSNIKMLKINFDKVLRLLKNDYDLIFSNMSFQWSQIIEKLIRNLTKKLYNSEFFYFSTLLVYNFD
ncbi:biotin synthase, partial [Francisella tularensis subsp. holarctica]|nr:biotin synthase [Francisella tularensis subsp. holarctica]